MTLQLLGEKPVAPKLKGYASALGHTLSLIEEHYEEAAALWDQMRHLAAEEDIPWSRSGAFENRFEAHLDALALSGEHAERMGLERFADKPDWLPVLLCLIGRNGNQAAFQKILEEMESGDLHREALEKAVDAEIPSAWLMPAWTWALQNKPALAEPIFRVAGARKSPFDPKPIVAAHAAGHVSSVSVYEFICRGKAMHFLDWLRAQSLGSDADGKHDTAILALLACGEAGMHSQLIARAGLGDKKALRLWALLGLPNLKDEALRLARASVIDWDMAETLVHGGYSGFIPLLVDKLASPASVEAAAWALQVLTGSGLTESHFELDPDDDPSPELRALRVQKGFPEQQGEMLERPCRNPRLWSAWWEKNHGRFSPTTPMRLGKPLNAVSLLESLQDAATPNRLHRLSYQEWRFRYGRASIDALHPTPSKWRKYFALPGQPV